MAYTKSELKITKERLEDLRKERKLSFIQLSEQLDKQGASISHTNLKNYEINDELHDLYNRTRGMSLENFVALADFYDVSVDYLLGRSKTKKAEYNQISEELKMPEDVIELIKELIEEDKNQATYASVVNMIYTLLLDNRILVGLYLIRKACYAHEVFNVYNSDSISERKADDEEFEIAEKQLQRYGMRAVNGAVLRDLYTSQAIAEIENVLRTFPINYVDDYQKMLTENL